jgi:hypothetical protein
VIALVRRLLSAGRAALERRMLGVSADEIRYTFEDVRAEIRATRAELLREIAELRAEVARLSGDPDAAEEAVDHPVADA